MKLHSKFHDYYDSALRYGQSDRHFVRETKELPNWFDRDYRVHPPLNISCKLDVYFGVVVFCGKVYPFAYLWNFGGGKYLGLSDLFGTDLDCDACGHHIFVCAEGLCEDAPKISRKRVGTNSCGPR